MEFEGEKVVCSKLLGIINSTPGIKYGLLTPGLVYFEMQFNLIWMVVIFYMEMVEIPSAIGSSRDLN